jgi:hypothetical protein
MVFPVGTRPIELNHYPRLGGARVAREATRRPLGNRLGDEPHCAVVRCDAPGSASLGCGTSEIGWKPAPMRACAQRHYPLAASDAAVAADELPQERGRGLAQESRRMGRFSTMCSAGDANYWVMRSTGRPEGRMLTSISEPCGRRLSGDEASSALLRAMMRLRASTVAEAVTVDSN